MRDRQFLTLNLVTVDGDGGLILLKHVRVTVSQLVGAIMFFRTCSIWKDSDPILAGIGNQTSKAKGWNTSSETRIVF